MGGASVLLALLHAIDCGTIALTDPSSPCIRAADANRDIVDFHTHAKTRPTKLAACIQHYCDLFNQGETEALRRTRYYEFRDSFNRESKGTVVRAALLWVLMRQCWMKRFRVNGRGHMMTSYGYRRRDLMLDKANLYRVSHLLNKFNVKLICTSYENSPSLDALAITYVDPPYYGMKSEYTVEGFSVEQQEALASWVKALPGTFIMSQSNHPWVDRTFPSPLFYVETVAVPRKADEKLITWRKQA